MAVTYKTFRDLEPFSSPNMIETGNDIKHDKEGIGYRQDKQLSHQDNIILSYHVFFKLF